MSFSVKCERTGFEYRGVDPNGLFAQRRNLLSVRFYRLLADWLRFNRDALRLIESADDSLTVEHFFNRHSYSQAFIEHYFLPMGSAVWSCPRERFAQFPIRFIAEFYHHHGMLGLRTRPQWRVISGGSRTYVRAMTPRFAESIRTGTPIDAVRRHEDGVTVHFGEGSSEAFDHVVFACHSDQALKILGNDATRAERAVLTALPYERNVALLHTDETVLPRSRRAWACWNYFLPLQRSPTSSRATVTYNMNLLQQLRSSRVYCVTLNGEDRVDPRRVIREFIYHHPVFDRRRAYAQGRRGELLNNHRTSFCGAYWGNGFHEDGVNSALAVCHALGEHEPWKAAYTKAGCTTLDIAPSTTNLATAST